LKPAHATACTQACTPHYQTAVDYATKHQRLRSNVASAVRIRSWKGFVRPHGISNTLRWPILVGRNETQRDSPDRNSLLKVRLKMDSSGQYDQTPARVIHSSKKCEVPPLSGGWKPAVNGPL